MITFFVILLIAILPADLIGSAGNTFITNFSRDDTGGAVQNWHVTQHPNGLIYVANQSSIRRFDGHRWKGVSFNRRATNTVHICPDEMIYAGGDNEFGYVTSDSLNALEYQSLMNHVPEQNRDFQRIHFITCNEDNTTDFYARNTRFRWNGEHIEVHQFDSEFRLTYSGQKIFAQDSDYNIYELISDSLHQLPDSEDLPVESLRIIVSLPDGKIKLSFQNGQIFIYDGQNFEEQYSDVKSILTDHTIQAASVLSDGTIAYATLGAGVVITDKNGNIISRYTTENGLPTNTVYHVFEDNQNGIWVAHDSGISRIEHFAPVRIFDESHNINMHIMGLQRFNNQLLMAGTSGTLVLDEASGTAVPLIHPEITWNWTSDITKHNNSILLSGFSGFLVLDEQLQLRDKLLNTATYSLATSKRDSNLVFYSTGNSLGAIYYSNEGWTDTGLELELPTYFFHSAETEPGRLWITPINNGIFRLDYEIEDGQVRVQEFRQYDQNNGLPENIFSVFNVGGQARFTSRHFGLFYYDPIEDAFVTDSTLHPDIAEAYVFRMAEDFNENIWLRSQNEENAAKSTSQKQLVPAENGYQLHTQPYMRLPNHQINVIYPEENGIVWFGGSQILMRYDTNSNFEHERDVTAHISDVFIRRDSVIYRGYVAPGTTYASPVLPYEDNELRFMFAAPFFDDHESTQYQVRLSPLEDDWQNWSEETMKDYTNLREGHYQFEVRAKDIYDNISEAGVFTFRILPPWYRTWWAYTLFGLVFFGILYGIHKFRITQITKVFETRNRIASDLHDEVSATISSINFFAEALERSLDDSEKRVRLVKHIKASAAESKDKISDIVWSVSPVHDDWAMLFTHFRRFASDILESKNIHHQISIPEDAQLHNIDMELRRNLWMIMKEIVNNAVKHSECEHMRIQIKIEQKKLMITIQDDGIGFDKELKSSGFGLKNIFERAERIGANISLETSPGNGTTWYFRMNV